MRDKNFLARMFDSQSKAYTVDVSRQPERYYYEAFFNVIFKGCAGKGLGLDIGCGAGTFTLEMARRGYDAYGLDLSQGMLLALKKRGISGVRGDAECLPFRDSSIDFITSVGVLEILESKQRALREIHRVLKPGGRAVLRWLNRGGVWGGFDRVIRKLRMPFAAPFSNYSLPKEGISEAQRAGFRVRRIEGAVILPLFMFPRPFRWGLELVGVWSGLAERLEGLNSQKINFIEHWYYAFFTELEKC